MDFMLGSYMEDIGITPDQFEEACGKGTGKVKKQFHHGLFEQVFVIFSTIDSISLCFLRFGLLMILRFSSEWCFKKILSFSCKHWNFCSTGNESMKKPFKVSYKIYPFPIPPISNFLPTKWFRKKICPWKCYSILPTNQKLLKEWILARI